MRDLLAAEPLRKSQIKGNVVWETVSGFRCAPPATDSHPVIPPTPGKIIVREAEYRSERQCPESGHFYR